MPHNYNVNLFNRAIELFNIKDGIFFRPDLPFVLTPVVPVTPIAKVATEAAATTTGTVGLFTTPSDKDFYLTNATLSYAKDATCDIATGNILLSATVNGVAVGIIRLAVITLTAQQDTVSVNFNPPLKLSRSTGINLTGSFTVGTLSRGATIQGYTDNTLS